MALFVLASVPLIGAGLSAYRVGDAPVIEIGHNLPAIGKATLITVLVTEPKRGVHALEVKFVQGKKSRTVKQQGFATKPAWMLWGGAPSPVQVELTVGADSIPDIDVGEGTIEVTAYAAETWMFAPAPVQRKLTLPVRLVPPTLEVTSDHIYVAQGGCEAVTYRVSETSIKDGVKAGNWFFPGYPVPGGKKDERFALFAVPYDMDSDDDVRLYAADDVGNEIALPFVDSFARRPYKTDTINVSDRFMETVVPRIMAQSPKFKDRGGLLANYVAINNEMRTANAQRLIELAQASKREFFWNQVFVQMSAQVYASFADRRGYQYEGREVDRQYHLGFDLASTKRAPIPAANPGLVVLAEYFGIYGNAVVIDHGHGLLTLYGHLSSIDVKVGDKVERGQEIGRTGATGLALGDHLHFTVLLHGLAVRPLEWWDDAWITNRIAAKLGDTLKYVKAE